MSRALKQRAYRAYAAMRIRRLHGEDLLVMLARVAVHGYGLRLSQWAGRNPPVGQHAPGSLHYQRFPDGTGCAFDAFAPLGVGRDQQAYKLMDEYAQWVRAHVPPWLDEAIHKPTTFGARPLSIKNGRTVPSSFWGPVTWGEHANHVHIGNT